MIILYLSGKLVNNPVLSDAIPSSKLKLCMFPLFGSFEKVLTGIILSPSNSNTVHTVPILLLGTGKTAIK